MNLPLLLKNMLKPISQKIIKHIDEYEDITLEDTEVIRKLIKKEIGGKTSFIFNLLYDIIKRVCLLIQENLV